MNDDAEDSQAATVRFLVELAEHRRLKSPSQAVTRVGQQMGNYQLVHFLAQGGFAEVYIGEHVHLGTLAAIKILDTQLASEGLRAFRDEARMVARLRHPHIINIRDFDVQKNTPFIVMDYAPHGTLRYRHPKGTVLSPTTILSYIVQIADALQYAHNGRVIHRDVKPENMLIGAQNELLLSDFGIAVALLTSHTNIEHAVIGTVGYMSPEQFEGQAFPASDQYALAVVAYEWLCGRLPFQGTVAEMAAQHINASPPPPHRFNPQLSTELEHVLLKALAKDPEQRYPSINDFARAIANACPATPLVLSTALPSPVTNGQRLQLAGTIPAATVEAGQIDLHEQQTVYGGKDSQDQLPELVPQPQGRRQTRRAVLLGLGGLAVVGAGGGGLFWYLRTHSNTVHSSPPRKPSPTPVPVGTQLIAPYHGHTDVISALFWSQNDASYIASASADFTVRVWQSYTGADVRVYAGHKDAVNALAWSPDWQQLASASNDKTVQIWNAFKDGEASVVYSSHSDVVRTIAWSHAADAQVQYLASGSDDKTVRVWKADGSDVVVYNKHTDAVRAVTWSPDGKHIASAGTDLTVQVWDPAKTDDNTPPIVTFLHHTDEVRAVAWSPDGNSIASAGADKTVLVWLPLIGGNPLVTYSAHTAAVNALAWSPDSQYIASGSDDGTVQIWKASDGSQVYTYSGHAGNAVYAVTWSPDGLYIASGGGDKTVQIWYA